MYMSFRHGEMLFRPFPPNSFFYNRQNWIYHAFHICFGLTLGIIESGIIHIVEE